MPSLGNSIRFHIRGLSPMLLHNGRLSDPLNEHAQRLKVLTSKKKKTEADLWEMARVEWHGGLYLTQRNGSVYPCMPGPNIEAMIRSAAKQSAGGERVKRGLVIPEDSPIIYDGPKDPDKLWETKKFYDRSSAGIRRSRVIRTRPCFPIWELEFETLYDEDQIDGPEIEGYVILASRVIGLSDWRPRNGLFEVVEVTRG